MVFSDDAIRPGSRAAYRSSGLLRNRMGWKLLAGTSARAKTYLGNLHSYRVRRKFMVLLAHFRGPHSYHGLRVPAGNNRGRMGGRGAR